MKWAHRAQVPRGLAKPPGGVAVSKPSRKTTPKARGALTGGAGAGREREALGPNPGPLPHLCPVPSKTAAFSLV